MDFFSFLFATIVFMATGSVFLAFIAWRVVVRSGRRLIGWVREQRRLPKGRQGSSQPAGDVVVEPVGQPDAQDAPPSASATVADQVDYVHLDPDKGTTPAQVIEVLRPYERDGLLGERATDVIQTLRSAERRGRSLSAEIDATFQRESLSWERFATPMRSALDALLRNSILLANRIQSFDTASYLRLSRAVREDAADRERSGAPGRSERLRTYEKMLASLDAIQETNERLLLELDKLSDELSALAVSGSTGEGDLIIEEIRRLVSEAQYYR